MEQARPTPRPGPGGDWPAEKPFPLTDAECAALIRGQRVKWPGTMEDFLLLPGKFEMMDGWIYLWRS